MILDAAQDWNPYYLAYCKANGHANDPDAMREADSILFPGGSMCGFTLWIGARREAFYHLNPGAFLDRYTIGDHAAWGAFLEKVVP